MKNWLIGIGAVVGLGAILFLSDRKIENPSGIELIRDGRQYSEANNKAYNLAFDIFTRAIAGGAITEPDKEKLREALKSFESMRLFDPTHVQSAFGSGMCYSLLGDKVRAAERFEQAVLNKRIDPLSKKDEKDQERQGMELTAFEAAAQLSELTLDLAAEEVANYNSLSQANDKVGAEAAKKRSLIYYDKAMEYANIAVIGVPSSARYLVDRANVYLALKKEDLAKEDVAQAKILSPDDPKVKMAVKMLGL